MLDVLTRIEDSVAPLLLAYDADNIDRSIIEAKVRLIAMHEDVSSEAMIQQIVRKLEERFNITMSLGVLFSKADHHPWLDDSRGHITWHYVDRYWRMLQAEQYSHKVISSMDKITDQILDHIENPETEGVWARKGLVVGHVQSGKTANYIGVICKAADAGYKVIIVLAGVLNTLRNQTQVRIEKGFTGVDSTKKFNSGSLREAFIGVGKYQSERLPITFTTGVSDFKKQIASQIGAKLASFNEPVVLVIKKNSSILGNLIKWIKSNNLNLETLPLLLIDDEADQASINTRKEDSDVTAINRKIRELLALFKKNSYIGYTATPFANIFIDPENRDDMLGDELFPRDFIISLDPPSNYVGSKRIFAEDADLDIVREISDYGDLLPLRHKIDNDPPELPSSLRLAIRVFILSRAARLLRGQNTHNSMLVNVSRFTGVQSRVASLIYEYLLEIRNAIWNNYALSFEAAVENTQMLSIFRTWEDEFSDTEFAWSEYQNKLKDAVSPITVIEVNSSRNSEPLDYSMEKFPNGRNVIAIGGLSLSRGLTLEGLTVSYFLRNTKMYDTLLQMGRWFGYRTGYEDVCRIYMPAESIAWYRYISGVTEELRDEFKRMRDVNMTPADFGLAVRTHPDSLIITARNKMRTGRQVSRKIALEGRLVETTVIGSTDQFVSTNFRVFKNMISHLENMTERKEHRHGFLYGSIPVKIVKDFIDGYSNHPASQKTDSKPLIEHIEWMEEKQGIDLWDVLVVSPDSQRLRKKKKSDIQLDLYGVLIQAQWRTVALDRGSAVIFNRMRVGSRAHEFAGLSEEEIAILENRFGTKSKVPPRVVRENRRKPLLMVHLIDCREHHSDQAPIFSDGIVAFGISFPGKSEKGKAKKLVEYMVNTVWWNGEYADTLDVEEDFDE